jgi:DNA polymerase III subunit delta'
MIELEPMNQIKLFGLNNFMSELTQLYQQNKFPNKLLLSGQKGLGKSTLAYHFINYVLSCDQDFKYDLNNFSINPNNNSYKTVLNKSNPNLIKIDVNQEKKSIDISQIRQLISNLNKSSFNNKPRFVLIDNIEYLNINSINALLKVLEEPNFNVHFILINNNRKILPTLLSRCINYKIFLTHEKSLEVSSELLNNKLNEVVNKDLINYYITPGNFFKLVKFAETNKFNLVDFDLKKFLQTIIKENYHKKDSTMKYMIFDFIEFYFRKLNLSFSPIIYEKYNYFIKRISNTRNFNLDEESIFMEFNEDILNG